MPWAMLAMDVIFGSKLTPDLLGIIAGHLYYFLTVLYPLSSGKNILKTPMWVYPFALSLSLSLWVQRNNPSLYCYRIVGLAGFPSLDIVINP